MKIIVSTFALKNFLNIAITRKYKNLTIAAETNQLQVTNKNPNGHGPILDFYLVPSSDSKINSYFKIDEIQLYDMVLFLNQLEEQPIIVEILQHGEDKLDFTFTQFIKRFIA